MHKHIPERLVSLLYLPFSSISLSICVSPGSCNFTPNWPNTRTTDDRKTYINMAPIIHNLILDFAEAFRRCQDIFDCLVFEHRAEVFWTNNFDSKVEQGEYDDDDDDEEEDDVIISSIANTVYMLIAKSPREYNSNICISSHLIIIFIYKIHCCSDISFLV